MRLAVERRYTMGKHTIALLLGLVMALGAFSLCLGSPDEPGPRCDPDPLVQCLDYVDPVSCVKPGVGRKTYSNACYAMKDCALMRTCRPVGQGPIPTPA
jgi:hypothetical protein